MNKKRVLHLLASNKYSGAENVVCTIIENFENEFEMCYCSLNGEIKNVLDEKKINFFPLENFNRKNLRKVIKIFKPDIIHAHDYRASILASFSGFKGKIISHLHINSPIALKWNLKSILYSLSSKNFSNVVGVSDSVYKEAIFKNKIKNKYITLYNFVDNTNIIKKSNEYEYEKSDLFFIGRLVEAKQPLKFIEIVNEFSKNNSNVRAVMIGDGDLKNDCIREIKNFHLEKNIEMVGFNSNPFPIIKNSKIGIMPSAWEGFGLTAIESIVLNKPILNSGVGGLSEIFKDNPEFICKNKEEYILKINDILDGKIVNNVNVDKFTDKNKWKEKLRNIYRK